MSDPARHQAVDSAEATGRAIKRPKSCVDSDLPSASVSSQLPAANDPAAPVARVVVESSPSSKTEDEKRKRRIAFFGSSLNPPTRSHVKIVEHFASEFDKVLVAPVYQHIYDSKRALAPFQHRVKMAELCFSNRDNVIVTEIEKQVCSSQKHPDEKCGTYDVLQVVAKENPDAELVLVLGGDTFNDLIAGKWKNGQQLMDTFQVAVFQREGWTKIEHEKLSERVVLHNIKDLGTHSSTAAREACLKDINQLKIIVPQEVCDYIIEHNLYM